ncbi:Tkl protein kinase, partial [Globisporangium splendens]
MTRGKRYLQPSRAAVSQTKFSRQSLVALSWIGYRLACTLLFVAADTLPAAGDPDVEAASSSSSAGTKPTNPLPEPTPAAPEPTSCSIKSTSNSDVSNADRNANDTEANGNTNSNIITVANSNIITVANSNIVTVANSNIVTIAISHFNSNTNHKSTRSFTNCTPSPSPVTPVTDPAPSQQPSGSSGSATSMPTTTTSPPSIPTSIPEKTSVPASTSVSPEPSSTAASTPAPPAQLSQPGSGSQPQSQQQSSEPTVTSYNSTTLPPGVDSNVLDGGQLVRVETTATTQNGHTSISYTIVVRKGDQIETVQRGGVVNSNSTTAVDINHAAPTLTPAVDPASGGGSVTSQAHSGSVWMSSGVIIGLTVGVLVVGLLIAICVISRRRRRPPSAPDEFELNSRGERVPKRPRVDDGYSVLETIHTNSRDDRLPTTATNQHRSSTFRTNNSSTSRHRSGSLWEDATIVAARIPFDKIEIQALVSRGGYGEVYRGVYRDQTVAVKKLLPETRKELSYIENFLREIKLAATFEHPQIVAFLGVAWESLSDLVAISEFMEGGDLRSLLVSFSEVGSRSTGQGFSYDKVKIALHVAHALTYLHSLQPQVLHRDLKSRNILLTAKWDAKITDFGASRKMASSLSSSNNRTMTAGVGSSLWMAPEVMLGRDYGEKADIFSFGVVLSELDTHELPYSHVHSRHAAPSNSSSSFSCSNNNNGSTPRPLPDTAILQLVSVGKLQVQFSKHCASEMKQLAQQCVSVDPLERPSAAEVLYQLHVVLRKFEERR